MNDGQHCDVAIQASSQASNGVSNQISNQRKLLRKPVWNAAGLLCHAGWYYGTGTQSSAGIQKTVRKAL